MEKDYANIIAMARLDTEARLRGEQVSTNPIIYESDLRLSALEAVADAARDVRTWAIGRVWVEDPTCSKATHDAWTALAATLDELDKET